MRVYMLLKNAVITDKTLQGYKMFEGIFGNGKK